jgi:hypothetical protein
MERKNSYSYGKAKSKNNSSQEINSEGIPEKRGDAPVYLNGGRATNSPPAKVKSSDSEEIIILASGIDSLDISINIEWENTSFFQFLTDKKNFAVSEEKEISINLKIENESEEWSCFIYPWGANGYEWLLRGREFTLKIGNWEKPKTRPSVLAQIRSECLWTLGPKQAVGRIIGLLHQAGGKIIFVKPSRVDLCVDFLFPKEKWIMDLIKYRVTRSNYAAPHLFNDKLTGISIGKGDISARLYDKELEIKQKSKKFWMFDVWGIQTIPENKIAIRVEFQIRREVIKETGIDTITQLFVYIKNLWAYCTKEWLKFQDNPGKHHTQRKTFDWWKVIQNSFSKEQEALPLIRRKAINIDRRQLFNQAYGLISSLTAAEMEAIDPDGFLTPELNKSLKLFHNIAQEEGKVESYFQDCVEGKRARYYRDRIKAEKTNALRKELGFPYQ